MSRFPASALTREALRRLHPAHPAPILPRARIKRDYGPELDEILYSGPLPYGVVRVLKCAKARLERWKRGDA